MLIDHLERGLDLMKNLLRQKYEIEIVMCSYQTLFLISSRYWLKICFHIKNIQKSAQLYALKMAYRNYDNMLYSRFYFRFGRSRPFQKTFVPKLLSAPEFDMCHETVQRKARKNT